MSLRYRVYLPLLVVLVGVFHASLFLTGYRLTADDVSFHFHAMNGLAESWQSIKNGAISQGRIGHFFDLSLSYLASYLAEYLPFRVFYVALFFANFFLAARYVDIISKSSLGWFLLLCLFAFHGLDYFHLAPNSYPLFFSVSVFLILLSRISLLKIRQTLPGDNQAKDLFWLALCLLAMLFNELSFALALSLILIEFVTRMIFTRYRDGNWRARFWHVCRQRSSLADFSIVFMFALIYSGFRLANPSVYEGNQPTGILQPMLMLKTMAGHASGASVFSAIFRSGVSPLQLARELDLASVVVLSGFFVAALSAFMLAMSNIMRDMVTKRFQTRIWVTLGLSLFSALLVAAPAASSEKYQDWCHSLSRCAYLDSGLSYLGYGIALACVILGLSSWILKRVDNRKSVAYSLSIVLALTATLSHAYNMRMERKMERSVAAWSRVQDLACAPAWFRRLVRPSMPQVIDPYSGVSRHPDFDLQTYWATYLSGQGNRPDCGNPAEAVARLYPEVGRGQKMLFTDTGLASTYLLDGWSRPKAWGTWSTGEHATLILPLDPEVEEIVLELTAMVAESHPTQKVVISTNDGLLGKFVISKRHGNVITLRLPRRKYTGAYEDHFVILRFEFPGTVTTSELTLNSDRRRLAIGLISLAVR